MGMMMNSDESLAKILGEKEPDYFIVNKKTSKNRRFNETNSML